MLYRRTANGLIGMETLKDFLWPIVTIGGLGAFIDFLIGKAGQAKAKDFLLKWWVRFDDVQWNNFGREEGLFAGGLIDRWFGPHIFSYKRARSAVIVFVSLLLTSLVREITFSEGIVCLLCELFPKEPVSMTFLILSFFCGFVASISFTRAITLRISRACDINRVKNFLLFSLMLVLNYLIMVYSVRTIFAFKSSLFMVLAGFENHEALDFLDHATLVAQKFSRAMTAKLSVMYPAEFWNWNTDYGDVVLVTLINMSYFPSIIRFAISFVFVGSFVVRPLIMRPISLVWARIIESEKPVFTVIFGAVAAVASAINETAKHL
jgi:hypothetical protein